MKERILNQRKISRIFQTGIFSINRSCKNLIKKYDLRYRTLTQKEKKIIKNESLLKIKKDKQKIARSYRTKIWYNGWQENYEEFKKTKNFNSIVPKYYTRKKFKIFRLGGKFINSNDPEFELKMLDIYRNWFLRTYFNKCSNIYEFGAGSGNNILSASKIFPQKKIYGLDFVKSSVNLINLISKYRKNIHGKFFDMSKPNNTFKIRKDSGFFSIGALEQLNNKIDPIINFFLKSKPIICVNIEPDLKYYLPNKYLEDKIAVKFQNKRGYTSNLFKTLFLLEKKNKIKIIKHFRAPFGSQFIEGYNFIAWKPK